MEAIDVLARIDGADDAVFIEVFWKRELNEDAVDAGIGIQLGNDFEEILLGAILGEFDFGGVETEICAGASLGADIDG